MDQEQGTGNKRLIVNFIITNLSQTNVDPKHWGNDTFSSLQLLGIGYPYPLMTIRSIPATSVGDPDQEVFGPLGSGSFPLSHKGVNRTEIMLAK